LERLYRFCERAKELLEPLNIGRVIARPFVGENPPTSAAPPPPRLHHAAAAETLLDPVTASGAEVGASARSPTSSLIAASPRS
jgi:phosphopentomutase